MLLNYIIVWKAVRDAPPWRVERIRRRAKACHLIAVAMTGVCTLWIVPFVFPLLRGMPLPRAAGVIAVPFACLGLQYLFARSSQFVSASRVPEAKKRSVFDALSPWFVVTPLEWGGCLFVGMIVGADKGMEISLGYSTLISACTIVVHASLIIANSLMLGWRTTK